MSQTHSTSLSRLPCPPDLAQTLGRGIEGCQGLTGVAESLEVKPLDLTKLWRRAGEGSIRPRSLTRGPGVSGHQRGLVG